MRRLTKVKRIVTERQITAEQANKFLQAVERAPANADAFLQAMTYIRLGADTMYQFVPKSHDWRPKSCFPAYVKREFTKGRESSDAYLHADRKVRRDLYVAKMNDLLGLDPIRQACSPLNLIEVERMASSGKDFVPYAGEETLYPVGTVNCTQEPGTKARFFASPHLIYQVALEPLQEFLMSILHACPQDACYGVADAISDVMELLTQGQTVYTYDLREATNTFLSSLTWYAVELAHSVPMQHLLLLQRVSEGFWLPSREMALSGFFPELIQWKQGQPLGTKPSFAAFAYSHHSLVRGIARSLERPWDCYYILGDDIVIFDELVAEEYRRTMLALGVQVPEEKSMVSNRVSEFGGQTILRSEAFYPGKWREINDDSLFTFIMDPVYDIERVVPRLWMRLIRRMQQTPYPFGLLRPQLEKLSHDEINQLCDDIELLFLKRILTPSGNESGRSDWLNDRSLIKRLAWNQDWSTLLYPRDERFVHSDKALFAARVLRMNDEVSFADKLVPERYSLPCLFWKETKVLQWIEEGIPNSTEDEQLTLYRRYVALSREVRHDFITACSLVRSIIMSGHHNATSPWDWVLSVRMLYDVFAVTRRELEHIDLVHAVISNFPHFEVEDFHVVRQRFLAILRRYSKPMEVMPSLAVQLPRLSRG
jgi:hypothetical protein